MEKTAFNVFLVTIALAIVAFLPPALVPFMLVKTIVIALGVLISLVLYIVSRIQAKSVEFPLHPLVIIGALLGLSVILSTVFSASPANSFINGNFDQYSGAFLLVVLAGAFLTTLFVRNRERVLAVVVTVMGSFTLIALFAILRLIFGNSHLQLGTFTALTSTMAGSWYDLAILAALVFVVSFLSLDFTYSGSLPANRRIKIASIVLLILSFIFLVIIDLSLIWIGVSLVTLLFVLYRIFFNRAVSKVSEGPKKPFAAVPIFAVVVFIVAAVFSWKGSVISAPIIQKLGLSYAEVSLPWRATMDIALPTLRQSALSAVFGAGPDRFPEQYLLYKPEAINHTQFWNIAFPSGSSFVLTSLVNEGAVGFLLWIILFVWFVVLGVKAVRRPPESGLSRSIVTISFLTTFFLWCILFLYSPSQAVIFLTLVMTGLFVAVLGIEYARSERTNIPKVRMLAFHGIAWNAAKDVSLGIAKKDRVMLVLLYVVLLCALGGIVVYAKDAIAQTYFQAGVDASIAGNLPSARASFEKALTFRKSDMYYQALAQVDTYEINSIISSASSASSSTVATIGSLINEGIGFARSGEAIDPANANNFLAEGDIAELAATLNVPNAYADSKASYGEAVRLSPFNPAIYLSAARLEYTSGSTTLAESDINAALELKPDYTDALFEAGVISYNLRDYQTAVEAFESVLKVDGTYANAEYFLGLTFARAGDTTDAITVFTDLVKAYPQNTTLTTILADLQAGRSIFGAGQAASQAPSTPLTPPKVSTLTKSAAKNTKIPPDAASTTGQ